MKKVIALILTGLSLSITQVASAEPVKVTGEVSVKYERDTAVGDPTTSGTMSTLKLRAETELGAGWSLYARLGAQYATQPSLADFNTAAEVYGADKKAVVTLDQFGLTYKADKLSYKLGRQDAKVGTTALLYSRPDTNIGKKAFVDGLSVSGTTGVIDVSALLAREDNAAGNPKNKVYAIRAGYNPMESLNWGLTLGRYSSDASTNHWAVDGTYKLGKSSLTAEYTKSSSNADNKAYATTLNYGFDAKTAVYITGFRVEANGDMGGQSDFDNGNKGIYYGLTYKLSDTTGLEIVYKDQKVISSGQKNTKLEATFTQTF